MGKKYVAPPPDKPPYVLAPSKPVQEEEAQAPVDRPRQAMQPSDSYLGEVLAAIDAAGKAMQARRDELWVPWNEETQSGYVYWHSAAASHLAHAMKMLVEVEDYIRAVDWPYQGGN